MRPSGKIIMQIKLYGSMSVTGKLTFMVVAVSIVLGFVLCNIMRSYS